jgi:hypothetical protein
VGRFFFTLAFLMLVLLLVDSGRNDPDVQPVVDRQITHVQHQIEAISGWLHTTPILPWNDASESIDASTEVNVGPHDGHGWGRYGSTMVAMAAAALSLAKSVTKEIHRSQVVAAISLRAGAQPSGRLR